MILPFRDGTAAVLRYASFRRIGDLIREWSECDFVVFPRDAEQYASIERLGKAGLAYGRPVESVSVSPCIASRSRAGVLAEGGAGS